MARTREPGVFTREEKEAAMRKSIRLRGEDRWASHAIFLGETGRTRHIVRRGGLTSVCGTTAMPVDTWRGNTSKPRCPDCVVRYGTREEQRG